MTHRSKLPSPWLAGAFLSLISASVASTASAQTPAEVAARRTLLSQAEEASRAGNHAQALELGERAGRISMTPSLRFFLATEQRALGHFADAQGNAELCAQTAERDQTLRNRAALISQCRGLITELQPQVPHVTVRVPSPTPQGLQVTIGGAPMSDAFWGVPFGVNPGHISIDATAPNHAAFHREIDIAAAGSQEVAIDVGPEMASSSPPPTEVVASAAPSPAPSGPPATPPPAPVGPGPLALAIGGGVVLVGGILLVAVVRPIALNRLDDSCYHVLVCADTNEGYYRTAVGATIGGGIAMAVGAAAIAGGIGWLFSARSSGSERRAVRHIGITPLAEGGGMISIGGVM